MNAAELREIIEKHGKWLRNEDGGKRAVLVNKDLSGSDLSGCNLSKLDIDAVRSEFKSPALKMKSIVLEAS